MSVYFLAANYYTKSEVDALLSGIAVPPFAISDVTGLQAALDAKSAVGHTHDDRYFTESEVTTLLAGKANSSHTHTIANVTGLQAALDLRATYDDLENLQIAINTSIADGSLAAWFSNVDISFLGKLRFLDDDLALVAQIKASGADGLVAETNGSSAIFTASPSLFQLPFHLKMPDGTLYVGGSDDASGARIQVVGAVKATSFLGPLTGNSTGTHTGAVTGNVTGNLTGEVNAANLDTNATGVGFYGITPVARAGATDDIKDALTAYGLLQGTSATPLNLDGGTFTAGEIVSSKRITAAVVANATVTGATATDAALGNQFNWTVTGNFTISNPTNATDGQTIVWRLKSATSRTIAFGTNFRGGTDVPLPTATTGSSKTDYLVAVYNAADTKWDVTTFDRGH